MAAPEAKQKLTAVFVTDVVGYSRLMGDDHHATVKTLAEYREVFSSNIQRFQGRVVNAPGDSILADFESVVDAVNSAVEIQRELAQRNANMPEHRQMHFRIGVNMGDVLVRDGELFGDGVNIAARLEALADPGGICISRPVHDQVKSRLKLDYKYLGEQKVKNIAEPVRAYKVLSVSEGAVHKDKDSLRVRALAGNWRRAAYAATAILLLAVASTFAWNYWQPDPGPGDGGLALPNKPSIAVLPFDNLSGNKEQDYFADGFTEDLITLLSRVPRLRVIARNSTFHYKGRAVDIKEVGRKLGVQHLVEGSVQKAGGRLRITAQLIDAATGAHVWAERYDRELKDLFALQDEITLKVVLEVMKELEVKPTRQELARIKVDRAGDLQAWDYYVQARESLPQNSYEFLLPVVRGNLDKALALDPDFEPAILGRGWVLLYSGRFRLGPEKDLTTAAELAERVIALNPTLAEPHSLLAMIAFVRKKYDQAVSQAKRAVTLNPNFAYGYVVIAEVLSAMGHPGEALAKIQQADALDPFPGGNHLRIKGQILYQLGRNEEAIDILHPVAVRSKEIYLLPILLIASYSAAGRPEARKWAAEYAASPRYIVEEYLLWKNKAGIERILADLAKAGLK